MKNEFFNFTGNLALNSIEGAINYHHPKLGSKTLVFVPKTKEVLAMWNHFSSGLLANDISMAFNKGRPDIAGWAQSNTFRTFETESHYVIGVAMNNPHLQWSDIISAYARQNHPVIDIRDDGEMTAENFQEVLDNVSMLIESEKKHQKSKKSK